MVIVSRLGIVRCLMSLELDSGELDAKAERLESEGQTVMFVVVDEKPAGLIGVADPIKETTPDAVKQLHAEGIRIVMLTGDSRTTAEAVARKLGIDEVVAEVLPDQKVEVVKRFQDEGRIVAMAGDGINDAPALAQAHVGIAMGTGTDVAMKSADVTLVKGDLARDRARACAEPRDDEQHQTESLLRVYLQHAGRADRGRSAVSVLRDSVESDDCRGGDEFQFRLGDCERSKAQRDRVTGLKFLLRALSWLNLPKQLTQRHNHCFSNGFAACCEEWLCLSV